MNIAAYPHATDLKDSGIPWIGEIPSHWQVKRLRHLTKKIGSGITPTGGALTYVDDGIPLLRSQNVLFGRIELDGAARISERVHQRMSNSQVRKGDVLLNITGGSIGRCHFVDTDDDLNVNQHVCIIRPTRDIVTQYLNFLLSSEVGQKQIWFWQQGGGREGLNFEAIKGFAFAIPPLPEQRAIAAILEGKCATIDEAVRIKEEQIRLLAERRQILIQQAVTRGLNPDAPMKDSGIDWIGQIPAHWEIRRNFALFRETKNAGNAGLPVLSVSIHSGVSKEELSEEENIRSIIKIEDRSSYKEVLPGDIAYNMMRAWQGGIGAVQTHGMVSPAYVVARPIADLVADYFELLYRTPAFIRQMDASSKGITDFRKRLYWDDFRDCLTIVPPKAEQEEIIRNSSDISEKIQNAISLKESQITALREYKTSLINAAVTGKIKVL